MAVLLLAMAVPSATSTTARDCNYADAHVDSWVFGISVVRTKGMRCSTGARILRRVGPHLESRDYRHLGLSATKRIAGYDCTAILVGDSAWHINCRRGGRTVTGFTAN